MITDSILRFFCSLVVDVLSMAHADPALAMTGLALPGRFFFECLEAVAYFLPMGTFMLILHIVIMEELFKVGLSLVKLVWKFIPLIGS